MKLEIDKQYLVCVVKCSFLYQGVYSLYFRGVFIEDVTGFIMLRFSESLDPDSVFYNFFIDDDFNTIC